jgi:hypothetical protein
MRRFTGIVMALALTACTDQATEPPGPAEILGGQRNNTHVDAGTATLIGDAGVFGGRALGWTDIALDGAGNLFATSRIGSELTTDGCIYGELGTGGNRGCTHLYVLDPGTGEVLAEIGKTDGMFVSDIEFTADGTLFGSEWFVSLPTESGGGLITLDPTTAAITLVGGFGPTPFVNQFHTNIQNGGISIHPHTGQLWGVESNFSFTAAIFRIDAATGVATEVIRLGLDGQPTDFGLDGFEILPNGAFLGLRGWEPSELYSINPSADPVSGLAELTLIPLALDPAIEGKLNGLESIGPVTPSNLLGDVEEFIGSGGLDAVKATSLISKISLAQKFLDEGRVTQAIAVLEAFIKQVNGYINGGNISMENGQALIDAAQAVINGLSL